jgi:uncharacterized coiled-coil DUF342 family protein
MDEADAVIEELDQLVQELQDELAGKIEEIEKLSAANDELKEEVDVFTEQVVNFEEVPRLSGGAVEAAFIFNL